MAHRSYLSDVGFLLSSMTNIAPAVAWGHYVALIIEAARPTVGPT